jgi:ATP-dependent Clp protease ATP-binding subunit ClpB
MEESLKAKVIGQDEPIEKLARAIRRTRAGLKDPKRPIGSFIFLGPTGVGKTELAKKLTEYLFDAADALIRVDMSEYMEKFSVSRLVGAPPGYVGYEEGGQLTERVRRKPYSVVLLDEIEKAHPDVFNILLQVLDDGILTDGLGRRVDFRNTIVIMTSNLGSELIRERIDAAGERMEPAAEERLRDDLMALLRQRLRPEFLNRIDETVLFHPLGRAEIASIVDIQFAHVQELARRSAGIGLELTDSARAWIADRGFDPVFGARPLKRVLQQEITNKLAEEILSGWIQAGETIRIDLADDGTGLTFETTSVGAAAGQAAG